MQRRAPAGQPLAVKGGELFEPDLARANALPQIGAIARDHFIARPVRADAEFVSPLGAAVDPHGPAVLRLAFERRPQGGLMPEIDDVRHAPSPFDPFTPPLALLSPSPDRSWRGEQGGESHGQSPGSDHDQVVVEVAGFGHDDVGSHAGPGAAPGQAFGGPLSERGGNADGVHGAAPAKHKHRIDMMDLLWMDAEQPDIGRPLPPEGAGGGRSRLERGRGDGTELARDKRHKKWTGARSAGPR